MALNVSRDNVGSIVRKLKAQKDTAYPSWTWQKEEAINCCHQISEEASG